MKTVQRPWLCLDLSALLKNHTQPYLYLYLFLGVNGSIIENSTQHVDNSSGPMCNQNLQV